MLQQMEVALRSYIMHSPPGMADVGQGSPNLLQRACEQHGTGAYIRLTCGSAWHKAVNVRPRLSSSWDAHPQPRSRHVLIKVIKQEQKINNQK